MNGLKKMRQARGMTLQELGAQIGVATNTVWQWESGRNYPTGKNYAKLCKFFNCTIKDLF